jgi:hypothetical protein
MHSLFLKDILYVHAWDYISTAIFNIIFSVLLEHFQFTRLGKAKLSYECFTIYAALCNFLWD